MKFLFLLFVNLINLHTHAQTIPLSLLRKTESEILKQISTQVISDDIIQKKYIHAARVFSERNEHENSMYLLEQALKRGKPTNELLYMYGIYLRSYTNKTNFINFFKDKLLAVDLIPTDAEEIDQLAELLAYYSLDSNTHIDRIQNKILIQIAERSTHKDLIRINKAITHARFNEFELAKNLLKTIKISGPEEMAFEAYLDRQLGNSVRFCNKETTPYYLSFCETLLSRKKGDDLKRAIRDLRLVANTPLHEAIRDDL